MYTRFRRKTSKAYSVHRMLQSLFGGHKTLSYFARSIFRNEFLRESIICIAVANITQSSKERYGSFVEKRDITQAIFSFEINARIVVAISFQ